MLKLLYAIRGLCMLHFFAQEGIAFTSMTKISPSQCRYVKRRKVNQA